MYCTKCGHYNAEDAKFCADCGSAMSASPPSQQTNAFPGGTGAAQRAKMGLDSQEKQKKAMETHQICLSGLKRAVVSPLFLITVICQTVATVLPLLDRLSSMNDYHSPVVGSETTIVLLLNIFNILTVIGLWCIYVAVSQSTKVPISATGLKMIRVSEIANIVMWCIVAFTLLVGVMQMSTGEMDGLLFLVLIVAGVLVAIKVTCIKNIKSAIQVMQTGTPDSDVSKVVAVLYIVSGCLLVFAAVIGIDALDRSGINDILGLFGMEAGFSLTMIAQIVSPILLGSMMLKYRSDMEWAENQVYQLLAQYHRASRGM